MPKELFRLLVCQYLAWMTIFSISLFFTDYVAQSIYKGDPSAAANSTEFMNYDEGVRMGCWCLLSISMTSAVSAVILEKFLLNIFSARTLYVFTHLVYGVCMGVVYFQTNIYIIMALSSSLGIVLTANYTLPYQVISEFHEDKLYRLQSAPGTKRGIGTDCALLSSVYFLSQFTVAAVTGLLTSNFGNSVIIIFSSLLAFSLCLWVSIFMIFPKPQYLKTNPNQGAHNQSYNPS